MPAESLRIKLDNQYYGGWIDIGLRRSIEVLCGNFQLGLTDKWEGDEFDMAPGTPLSVYAGEDLLITGYLNETSIDIDAQQKQVKSTGRCRTQDLVDCSTVLPKSTWSKVSLYDLCKQVCDPFGIKVIVEAQNLGEDIRDLTLNEGDSPFELIRRVCADRAVLPISNVEGNLVLTTGGKIRTHDAFVYGQNVLKAQARVSDTERFSEYTIQGSQTSGGGGWGTKVSTSVDIKGKAEDPYVKRYRPKIISLNQITSYKLAKARASWEAQVQFGKSVDVSLSVVGWRQSNGDLWRENLLVPVDLPPLKIFKTDMIISEINYIQNDSDGTQAHITLKRPEIYAAEPTQVVKKKKRGNMSWG